MKSLLEIVTILVLLFCITMLEKMDKACRVDRPSAYHKNTKQQKVGSTVNFTALVVGSNKARARSAK